MSSVSMIDGHIDKMTNYERIKQMSIDEMAYVLMCPNECDLAVIECYKVDDCCDCISCVKKWLESEVETE